MNGIREYLKGKKTNIVGIIATALGLLGVVSPEMYQQIGLSADPETLLATGLGLLGLRAAIKKGV